MYWYFWKKIGSQSDEEMVVMTSETSPYVSDIQRPRGYPDREEVLKEAHIISCLHDVLSHGYGHLDICIQDGKVITFQVTKSYK